MSALITFLAGLGITLATALLAVIYLQNPLKKILVDLCGNSNRAEFWTAFSSVTLTLVPVIFCLGYRPESTSMPGLAFDLCTELEWALVGLVSSVIVMGLVLWTFIPRTRPQIAAPNQGAE